MSDGRKVISLDSCSTDDVGVVFTAYAAEEFEDEHEADDSDAGAAEHAVGCDVP